jgi:hypothetical protein|tara:strand:+ start:67 stop:309 length:243 start_codon:yes stop_codon:yes gene_type:complete
MKNEIDPDHYQSPLGDVISFLKSVSTKEEFQGHLRLNALKYLSRCGRKILDGDIKKSRINDLKKSMWYIKALIKDINERG